jgi:molybdopterin-binding protein
VVRIESKADHPVRTLAGEFVCPGDNVTYTAIVDGIGPEDKPTFKWTVTSGEIISGQGTSAIRVATEEPRGVAITATVEVGRLDALKPECSSQASVILKTPTCCVSPCPTISISCPIDLPILGGPLTVSVSVSGGDPNINPKYKWQVSAGKIVGGQGTTQISVDTSGTQGQTITATVEVDGLDPECDRTESCSFRLEIGAPVDEARKFYEYGDVSRSYDDYGEMSRVNEETHLSNFELQLRKEHGAQGYVIVYGPRRVRAHLERARKFLIEKRGLETSRIVVIDGGYRKKTKVELWLRPTGAEEPILK